MTEGYWVLIIRLLECFKQRITIGAVVSIDAVEVLLLSLMWLKTASMPCLAYVPYSWLTPFSVNSMDSVV